MIMTKQEIVEQLKAKVLKVTFTKVDGTERIMNCTLREDILPQAESMQEYDSRNHGDHIVPVWDIDKEAWRSFRLENLKAVE